MQVGTTDVPRSGVLFDDLVTVMHTYFAAATLRDGPHLFRVETASDLWETYLNALPQSERQHHTCSACKQFVRRYGALAVVGQDGSLTSAIWPDGFVPEPYQAPIAVMRRLIARGTITGVALSTEPTWGTPITGEWTHFAVTPAEGLRYRESGAITAGQAAAVKHEDYGTLQRGLAEFDRKTVAQALTLLEADSLYRAEKMLGPARFLLGLHDMRDTMHGRQRDNLVWRAVAGAPVGFCQPRSTMVGTLLEDIQSGMDFEQVRRRFAAKMHPLQYQRPQAAPAAGAIAQAEKLVEQLGIEPSLHRRFARLAELTTLWLPQPQPERSNGAGGVFGHLLPKGEHALEPMQVPAQTITWEKFARTVLPTAHRIESYVSGRMNFCALLTAVNEDAPPILQWDSADRRNPFSWYIYHGGSTPEYWGLASGTWVPVTAVTLQPSMWMEQEQFSHQGKGALLILDGARDTHSPNLALFPEILQSSLHAVRAVIEAYSASQRPEGAEQGDANGLHVGAQGSAGQIRVTTPTGLVTYRIDRWD